MFESEAEYCLQIYATSHVVQARREHAVIAMPSQVICKHDSQGIWLAQGFVYMLCLEVPCVRDTVLQ